MNLKLWTIVFLTTFSIVQINSISMKLRCSNIRYMIYSSETEIHSDCDAKHLKILKQNETIDDLEMIRSTISYSSSVKKVSLTITASVVYYIPFGIETKLGNLTSLSIKYSKLREVHQYNLEPFTELKTLSFEGNDIQVIEPDLFKSNLKLTEISLEHNQIQHVEPNVFNELKKLERIYFNFNPCVMHTIYDRWLKSNITAEIYENCKPRVDESSNWKESEEQNDEAEAKNCSCLGLLAFTIILSFILVSVPILLIIYFYKVRRMSLMEMKESLVQFSAINDHL
ncbi:hypothetical protein ACKWTF_016342 [Chironomus riparius]